MNLIHPPKTNYTSMDDIGKFNMMWNVSLVLMPVFAGLMFFHLTVGDGSWATSLFATCVAFLNLLILKKLLKYKLIALTSILVGTIIAQASIFLIPESYLIADMIWCLLVGIFAFFLLGSMVGSIVLMFNITGLLVYLMYGGVEDLMEQGMPFEKFSSEMAVNAYFVAAAFAFIVFKMIENIKEGNERYEKEIKRNEILLKEIHHRVKNNLQIISSLLRLQAAETEDKATHENFNEAINRIRSMALIHEKMYSTDDLSRIDIQSYLLALVHDITQSIQSNCNIEVNVKSEINKVDINSVVPISLIFNELITNSIKHGFKSLNHGQINVDIYRKDSEIHFRYSDNGAWIEPSNTNSFGLELIRTLTDQLNGSFGLNVEDGTQYDFKFSVEQFIS